MKNLIFMLLMAVAFVGFVSALDTAHPPGVLTMNMADTLEAVLYGDSAADGLAVTPDTVLAALPATVELSSFQAGMANYEEIAIQPSGGGAIPVIDTGQEWGYNRFQAGMANYEEIAIQPSGGGAIPVIDTGQEWGYNRRL